MELDTSYLGLELANPLLAAASPLSYTLEGIRRLAAGGVGAIVLFSLFEEQLRESALRAASLVDTPAESFAEALDYVPQIVKEDAGPRRYLTLLERAVAAVEVPVIASLNAATPGGCSLYARQLQDAGAAAIELNTFFLSADPRIDGPDVEARHIEILESVKGAVGIPVAVKLSPFFSSTAAMAHRLVAAGADGLVLFNRFQGPEVDPESLTTIPRVHLSSPADGTLARTWIALLHGQLAASLAATSGVEVPADLVRYLLAGADVVMSASALLRHGPGYAQELLGGLSSWMARKGFGSVEEFRGLLAAGAGLDTRAAYVAAVRSANAGAYTTW
jgi:dihydroorotate dehydrogenase (fumarate)